MHLIKNLFTFTRFFRGRTFNIFSVKVINTSITSMLFLNYFRKPFFLENFSFSKNYTAQKMKFSIKDFFSKCDHICRKLWIWIYLMKKPLMENFIFCGEWRRGFSWIFHKGKTCSLWSRQSLLKVCMESCPANN